MVSMAELQGKSHCSPKKQKKHIAAQFAKIHEDKPDAIGEMF